MTNRLFLCLVFAICLSAGCGRSRGEASANGKSKHECDSSYHERARKIMMKKNGSLQECIALQTKAVEELREGESRDPAVDVLSQMGYIYSRSGDFLKGLSFLEEAADSLDKLTERGVSMSDKEIVAAIKLYGNTSNMYVRMGLYDEALKLSDKALKLSDTYKSDLECDLWIMRSTIYSHQSAIDSAIWCQRRSFDAIRQLPDSNIRKSLAVRSENFIAYNYLENPEYEPDSLAAALKTLERNMPMSMLTHTDSILAGKGYAFSGNPAKGIRMIKDILESGHYDMRGFEDREFAMRMLAESILKSSLSPSDYEIYLESRNLTDSMAANLKSNALLGADFRYRTSRIQSDKQMLENELRLTRRNNILQWIVILLMLVIAIAAIVSIIRRKNRFMAMRKAEMENMIEERIRLNQEIERMRTEIMRKRMKTEDSPKGETDPESSATHDIENETIESIADSDIFSMVLLTQKDETRFRHIFSKLYPGFVENIRSRHSDITPNSELVMMLIRLRKSNDEIALVLGIKRESVLKARYRLRSILSLPKDADLNEYILSL